MQVTRFSPDIISIRVIKQEGFAITYSSGLAAVYAVSSVEINLKAF